MSRNYNRSSNKSDIQDTKEDNLEDNSQEENNSNDIEQDNSSNVEENNFQEEKSNNKKNKGLNILIIFIAILIIIAIVILLASFLSSEDISLLEGNSKNKIELKYTDTIDNSNNKVYLIDVSEVVENVMPSIVAITSKTLISTGRFGPSFFGSEQYAEGAGSGIIVSQSDNSIMILTNNHVVEGTSELSVQFINEKSYDAKVVGTSERKDIAIISVPISSIDNETLEAIKIATIGDSSQLKVGNGIIAIGNALGYGQSVTVGVVSALNREVSVDSYTNKMIQIDAAINGGNSGGALLNYRGEVVGINSAKYSSNGSSSTASIEGMGFAIPISDVTKLITSLMNGEEDDSPTLGIEGYVITKQYSSNYNIPTGFYITKISPGSSADKSDLEIGNIITQINGKEVNDINDIQDVLYNLDKGDVVELKVKYISGREYKEKEVKVTLS